MSEAQLRKLLVCFKCRSPLTYKKISGFCLHCNLRFKFEDSIWHCIGNLPSLTNQSKKKYDSLFEYEFGGPNDGYYEILAHLAKGNHTVDISCGTGLIEKLSPQSVGVDFSLTALRHAQENGAKHLILADAHQLPFKDNAFEIAISAGNLEHFEDPYRALSEMARISRIQVLIVHKLPPIPFATTLYKLTTKLFRIQHQPIERPFRNNELDQLIKRAGLRSVFKGVWTLPFNYGRVIKWLPELKIFPSAWFVISIKD